MNICIIEDEQHAADRLEELIQSVEPGADIAAKLPSVEKSVQWLKENTTDLIFLDIQLSDGLCFSIFEQIKVTAPVIFTTAFDQYAMRAFELYSIDYLLKPIRKADIQKSLDKYRSMQTIMQPDLAKLMAAFGPQTEYKKRFLIKTGDRITTVNTKDAAFFYAMDKCLFLTTFKKQNYIIDYTLDKLQEILDPDPFFRINRKMIIQYSAIKDMIIYSRSRYKVDLQPQAPSIEYAIVSGERMPEFRKWIDK
ncbi:MAG: LytTR family DNA-binding domain-containing protein [candidate division KSB1 bacterium]|nr:LytTR family DNA-binding domain-containing protein [candidate division KSB1 bacterium]